ncbi:sigma-E processing peptidase SpoIIGA [Clostridium ganghwense]|uniref:Sigma-E processing peptidase SpoIIGA n=1 Tax=Clostridium ganghwense TaxID=312089 RepID=A0ABT4CTF2_9CLOT|nr:sigma-E processing peptidase SpoIIGA [Clostridium ganghwense]MCY6372332.1 sigma-E processing peptidase SpoIIGA [Clostridium ganghwense]
MIVYLDIFLIENFIVNLFLLYVTTQTLKIRTKMLNNILAAMVGSGYAVIAIYTKFNYLSFIPIKFIVAVIMILILFRKKDFLFNIKATIIFILYSMLLAGLCIFIEFNKSVSISMRFNGFSYKILLSSLMIIYVVVHRILVYVKDRKSVMRLIYDVDIVTDKVEKKVKAFLDTGNELREPITNLPVMIVEKDIFNDIKISDKEKFLIPYKVVNGSTGKLEGFRPQLVRVYKENTVENYQVIVAFCENQLSSLDDYNALLSRGIL